jgi:adenylate kinase
VYRSQTAPVVEYYRRKGLLCEIDGEGPREEIFGRIRAAVDGRRK